CASHPRRGLSASKSSVFSFAWTVKSGGRANCGSRARSSPHRGDTLLSRRNRPGEFLSVRGERASSAGVTHPKTTWSLFFSGFRVAHHGMRLHPVPIALVGECSIPVV